MEPFVTIKDNSAVAKWVPTEHTVLGGYFRNEVSKVLPMSLCRSWPSEVVPAELRQCRGLGWASSLGRTGRRWENKQWVGL